MSTPRQPDPPRPSAGFIVVNTLLLWAATAVAARRAVADLPGIRSSSCSSRSRPCSASVVAILGAVFRWRSYVVILVALRRVPARRRAARGAGSGDRAACCRASTASSTCSRGVALGWKQLLTITLPVGDYQALLVPAFVLVLTTHGRRPERRAAGEVGRARRCSPPIALFVVGIAFGPETAPWPVRARARPCSPSMLLWLIWRRWRRRRESIRSLTRPPDGRAAASRALESGFGGAHPARRAPARSRWRRPRRSAAASALPPTGDRDVLRTAIEQPFDPRDYAEPARRVPPVPARRPRATTACSRVTGLPEGARIRIATLDSYDGVVYAVGSDQVDSASGTFVRIPSGVDQSGVAGRPGHGSR